MTKEKPVRQEVRLLQFNGFQSPGRRFNGLSLKPYLAELGISSSHFVWERDKEEDGVISIESSSARMINRLTRGVENVFSLQSQLYSTAPHIRQLEVYKRADILHFHIIHSGFMSMQALPGLTSEKPSFWTLHDPWAMTGHCIHPFSCNRWKTGCGKCPDLDTDFRLRFDTTALNFSLKKSAIHRSTFEVIVASQWMSSMLLESPIFEGVKVHRIPFGLDLEYFRARDQSAAKLKLGIESNRLVVCFRSVVNDFKGLEYAIEALHGLNTRLPVCLLTLNDKGRVEQLKHRFQVVEIGWTNDDEVMRNVYDATDVFLMPSLADSFGLMAVEAMAFGKPTICFEGTALPEVIFANEAGIAVPSRDAAALSAALLRLLENPEERLRRGERSRQLAEANYDIRVQAKRLDQVYRDRIYRIV